MEKKNLKKYLLLKGQEAATTNQVQFFGKNNNKIKIPLFIIFNYYYNKINNNNKNKTQM